MNQKLHELETSLFKKEYINNIEYLEKIFHKDYFEYGKSGGLITRKETIDFLLTSDDRDIKIIDFESNKIDRNTYIVHYKSIHNNNLIVFRTSIWLKENDEIKLYFHQGTKINIDTNN